MMTLVERIKIKCEENNLTIRKLEQLSGLSNATIRKWETQTPSYDKVVAVAKTLHVSLNWLIFGKESEELSPDEQQLIDLYRHADTRGKRSILKHAEAECTELESSTSMIG